MCISDSDRRNSVIETVLFSRAGDMYDSNLMEGSNVADFRIKPEGIVLCQTPCILSSNALHLVGSSQRLL